MTFVLVPVCGGNLASKTTIGNWGRYSPFFDDSPYKTPWALINAHYHNKMERSWFHKDLKIIMDSGGFQMASLGAVMEPKAVMELQNKMCDIAIGLDDIPVTRPEGGTLTAEEINAQLSERIPEGVFLRAAENTRKYCEQMLEVKAPNVKLYPPIHGASYQQRVTWTKIVERDHEFDGYALKSSSHSDAINACAFMWDYKQKPCHLLGVGLPSRTIPFVYFQRHYKPLVTADTTTWAQGMRNRIWMNPITHRNYPMKSPKTEGVPEVGVIWKHKGLPCSCTFCVMAPQFEFDQTEVGFLMSGHNLLTMQETITRLADMNIERGLYVESATEVRSREEKTSSISFDSERLDFAKVCEAIDLIPEKGGAWVAQKYASNRRQLVEAFF